MVVGTVVAAMVMTVAELGTDATHEVVGATKATTTAVVAMAAK